MPQLFNIPAFQLEQNFSLNQDSSTFFTTAICKASYSQTSAKPVSFMESCFRANPIDMAPWTQY